MWLYLKVTCSANFESTFWFSLLTVQDRNWDSGFTKYVGTWNSQAQPWAQWLILRRSVAAATFQTQMLQITLRGRQCFLLACSVKMFQCYHAEWFVVQSDVGEEETTSIDRRAVAASKKWHMFNNFNMYIFSTLYYLSIFFHQLHITIMQAENKWQSRTANKILIHDDNKYWEKPGRRCAIQTVVVVNLRRVGGHWKNSHVTSGSLSWFYPLVLNIPPSPTSFSGGHFLPSN